MTKDLHATRGGTRTATNKHQQEEHNPKERRPGCVVADEEPRGGESRDDTEERLAEGSAETQMAGEYQHDSDAEADE